jgi:hypothetical protein
VRSEEHYDPVVFDPPEEVETHFPLTEPQRETGQVAKIARVRAAAASRTMRFGVRLQNRASNDQPQNSARLHS